MNLIHIKHVGPKPVMHDIYYGTNLIWVGDEVHPVPSAVAPKLLQHPDVWAAVDPLAAVLALETPPEKTLASATTAATESTAPPPPPPLNPSTDGLAARFSRIEGAPTSLMDNDGGIEINLGELDEAELKLWARTSHVKADFKLKGQALLESVLMMATKPLE
ncbi:hypothetical protein UFOVP703_47 [uncultured Caudovirales phage]|uniref:Uncharacterized protein n=1 Tax=uncultured Caudovirales phage TaxID=2100421 RepID=A0A6J5NI68_9CAUD|nr:hypothetical protein UFOVP703_47 [uncultured Caudovirales phage]